ncbi:unnamed protein product [Schistocephalus solidus]|uniref:Secreted protein n=1 Tax=Schistocephalus solidus TaxID=70667 RepID=A0A183T8L6_SCHSO|nr:unnamed protein product [Schistocephalus solidus]
MVLWRLLAGTQLSLVCPQTCLLPSGHTSGKRHDWRDKPATTSSGFAGQRDAGVAFAIWNDIVGRLPRLPQGIIDRPVNLRLHLRGDKFATIISAYAPPPNEL